MARVRVRRALGLLCLGLALSLGARAGTLQVTVVDARDRAPISGAFVMVGPGKGIPFAGNTALTSPQGSVVFQHPDLVGPQTVTAGATGYAYFCVIESAVDAVTLPLYPTIADTVLYGPKARVTGQVTNIATVNNDGYFDLALVLPALTMDQFIGTGGLAFEVPPDEADLPLIGRVPFPGNLVMPTQVEFLVLVFSKPNYKIDLPAQTTQTLFAVAARIPVDVVLNLPDDVFEAVRLAEPREIGVERNVNVGNGIGLTINSDHNLLKQLTVEVVGAPAGSRVQAISAGILPDLQGNETFLGYDTDFALADTAGPFLLASSVAAGDISDVRNVAGGLFADTSAYLAYTSGRFDRTPFTLPATRVISDLYDAPIVTETGAEIAWSAVAGPGEPEPTWSIAQIILGPSDPTDTTFVANHLWRIVTPAGRSRFVLPSLPAEAPGPPAGLIDPDQTPDADRLLVDVNLANPVGTLAEVLVRPSSGATHFARRSQELSLRPAAVPDGEDAAALPIQVRPNPSSSPVRLGIQGERSGPGVLMVFDLSGRAIRALPVGAREEEVAWDLRDVSGRRVTAGSYFVRWTGGSAKGKLSVLP